MALYLGSESMQFTIGQIPPACGFLEQFVDGNGLINHSAYSNNRISYIGPFAFADRNILTIDLPNCTSIGEGAFMSASLISMNIPKCTFIGKSAFGSCFQLSVVDFPECTFLGANAFSSCFQLKSIKFPECTVMDSNVFNRCTGLTVAYIPKCTSMSSATFTACYNLISLYLTSVSSVTNISSTTFNSTPISNYSTSAGRYGSVYVPSSLYSSFIVASIWSNFSSRIVGMYWNQLVSETCSIGSATLDGTNYYLGTILSDYNAISASVLKITLNEQEYICSQYSGTMYNYTTYGYGASADFTTMTPYLDIIHPFLLFCQDRGNIFVNSLVISSDIAKKDDVMSIIIEEQVNCLP